MSISYPDNTSSRTAISASGITDSSLIFDVISGGERSLSLAELKKTGISVINVKQYGALGNGTTDDTVAIQAAINAIPTYGGTVYLAPGKYLITSRITIAPGYYLNIVGAGIGPYWDTASPLSDPSSNTLIYCSGVNAGFFCERSASTPHRGLRFADFSMRSDASYTSEAAFRFDTSNETTFCRQFDWERVGCTYFKRFILVEDTGASSDKAWGVFRIQNCTVQNNKSIINTGSCRINHLVFRNNDAGNNTDLTSSSGRIHVVGSSIDISNNIIEGCNNPIYLDGCDSGITIRNNHFEAITGDYIAYIRHPLASYIDVAQNLWPTTINSTLVDGILIQGTNAAGDTGFRGRVNLLGYVHPQNCILSPENVDNLAHGVLCGSGSTEPVSFVSFPVERWNTQPPITQLDYTHAYDAYVSSPFSDGKVVRGFTPSIYTDIMGTVSFTTGDWVFCTWLMRRNDTNTTQHRAKANFTLYSSGSNVSTSRPFYMSYDLASGQYTPLRKRWTFCCIGWQSTLIGKASDNVRLQLIPYDEAAGNSEVTGVVFYAMTNPNDFRPWIPYKWMVNDGYGAGTDLDATPTAAGLSTLYITNSSGTTVTDFDNDTVGQNLTVVLTNGNTTISNNANIKLDNSLNFTPPSGGTLSLINYSGVWYETARATF